MACYQYFLFFLAVYAGLVMVEAKCIGVDLFIYITLVLMYHMSRRPDAMSIRRAEFPWNFSWVMPNTLLGSCELAGPIENDTFPLPEKDDVRSNRETLVFSQNQTKN